MAKKNDVKQDNEVTGLFAFWRYDQYPYVLGAPVTKMDDEGRVYAPSYQGWFTPIKIVPLKKGKELLDALKNHDHGLEHQRRRALAEFDKKWDDALFVLFPEARDPSNPRHREGNKGGA